MKSMLKVLSLSALVAVAMSSGAQAQMDKQIGRAHV